MKITNQLYVTDLAPGWKGVYSPFRHGVAFLASEIWSNLQGGVFQAVDGKIIDYLVERQILVEEGFEERWRSEQRVSQEVRLTTMFLVTTQDCNLGCDYCAVMENLDAPWRRTEKMSLEVGLRAVEFFERHLHRVQPEVTRVTFYGGEPTLNQELLFGLTPRIRAIRYPNQGKPVEIIMISNGYLHNPELVELFKENQVSVCISMDGLQRHQDVARVTRSGRQSTFSRVVENFRRYQEAGLAVGVSTALGSHNAFDLQEICEFYATELHAPVVEFQIPYQVRNESNRLWVSTSQISRGLMQAYETLRRYGVPELTTTRRLQDFWAGRVRKRDCGSSSHQLVVAPDGSIGPCHSLVGTRKFFAGNVADEACDPAYMDNFREWARRYPLNMPECLECPFIALCGGGCIYNAYVSSGTIWAKDPQVCAYLEEMVHWILLDAWKNTGMAGLYGVSDDS